MWRVNRQKAWFSTITLGYHRRKKGDCQLRWIKKRKKGSCNNLLRTERFSNRISTTVKIKKITVTYIQISFVISYTSFVFNKKLLPIKTSANHLDQTSIKKNRFSWIVRKMAYIQDKMRQQSWSTCLSHSSFVKRHYVSYH